MITDNEETMKTFKLLLSAAVATGLCFGQATTTSTTWASAISGPSSAAPAPTTVCVASGTGISAPSFGNPAQTALFADHEYMLVLAATGSTTCWVVARGQNGTEPSAHASGGLVWVGPAGGGANSSGLMGFSPYIQNEPAGGAGAPCTPTALQYTSLIKVRPDPGGGANTNGSIWSCPASGAGANTWVKLNSTAPASATGTLYYVTAGGANNALTVSLPGVVPTDGTMILLHMDGTHTLQAGANTIAFNGGSALALKSHFNIATNIGTAYAATGTLLMKYDSAVSSNAGGWVDMSQ